MKYNCKMIYLLKSFLLILTIIIIYTSELKPQNFDWVKGISSSVGIVFGDGISVDANGNSYVSGFFIGTASFDTIQLTSYGNGDIFIAKYDPYGNCLWAKHAGGNGDDGANSISLDPNGNAYISGSISGLAKFGTIQLNSYGDQDIFIAKYDINGNCLWVKHAGDTGSNHSSSGHSVAADKDGNSYLTGFFSGTALFDSFQLNSLGDGDIFIAKYDPDGNCLWVKKAGGSIFDFANGISIDKKGNSYITGGFTGPAAFDTIQLPGYNNPGWTDIFIAKYDPTGTCLWAKQAGGKRQNNSGIVSYSISVDAAGSSFITGDFMDTTTFGTKTLINLNHTTNYFVAKYDLNGNCLWADQVSGYYNESIGYGIASDSIGNCYATGYFHGASLFGAIQLEGFGGHDIFVTKYDPNGNCLWARQAGGADQDDYGSKIFVDAIGNSYTTGFFDSDTAAFGTIKIYGPGAFITKIKSAPQDIKTEKFINPGEYSLRQNYPNPFNPGTIITYSLPSASNIKIIVYNTLGQTIKTLESGYKPAGIYSINFNASNLPSGIYFYKLEAGSVSQIKKMILLK